MNIKNLLVKGDSNLAIQQVTGKWKVKNENLNYVMGHKYQILTIFSAVLRTYTAGCIRKDRI